jgi:hypothetical protein
VGMVFVARKAIPSPPHKKNPLTCRSEGSRSQFCFLRCNRSHIGKALS